MDATARKHIAHAVKELESIMWSISPEDQNLPRQARARLIASIFADGYELTTQYRVIKSKRGPELYREAIKGF